MVTIGPDEARAGIAPLLDRVERGGDVLIRREPRVSAVSGAGNAVREPVRELDKLRARLPPRLTPDPAESAGSGLIGPHGA